MSVCGDCKFRREMPGDCHITCGKAFNMTGLEAVMALLAGAGRCLAPDANKPVDFTPEMKHWRGCGSWPSLFDENIIVKCDGKEVAA
jgi:hypothetical protein